ncbi:MAG: hypothetical protein JJ891_00890 [Rhizobiaceae bacterium]|nr:hypothetical protein [Rhizobiaceae bacterium]
MIILIADIYPAPLRMGPVPDNKSFILTESRQKQSARKTSFHEKYPVPAVSPETVANVRLKHLARNVPATRDKQQSLDKSSFYNEIRTSNQHSKASCKPLFLQRIVAEMVEPDGIEPTT